MAGKVYPAIKIQRENITLLMVKDNGHCQIKIALRNAERERTTINKMSSEAHIRLPGAEMETIVS